MQLQEKFGHKKWTEAEEKELGQIDDYNTLDDRGKDGWRSLSPEYKEIRCHMVYDVKHDLHHKARFVAGGHMTEDQGDS